MVEENSCNNLGRPRSTMIPVYCPLCCDQPFDDQDSLFHHLRTLRNNLFCPICSERFSSFDHLVSHLSRKCNGPASPHEAKRKCLFSNSKLTETLPVLPMVSPGSLDPANTLGEVTRESSPVRISETASVCSSVGVAITPSAPSVIPPELNIRFPKGVTVSLGPMDNVPPQQSLPVGGTLLENKKVNNSPGKSTDANNSLSSVLDKVALNPNVELSIRLDKQNESPSKKSALTVSTVKDSPISLTENKPKSSPPFKQARKAGPMSSKLKEYNRNSLEAQNLKGPAGDSDKQKRDQVSSKKVSDLDSKSENVGPKEINGVEVNMKLQNECKRSRKRGRPKNVPDRVDDKSPVLNGIVNQKKMSSEPPVNDRLNSHAKIDSTPTVGEASNKRPQRTKRKPIRSYAKFSDSDDSDHCENYDTRGSDEDYEPQDMPNSLIELEGESEAKLNGLNKDRSKATKKVINTESGKINTETEKTNVDPEKKISVQEKPNEEPELSSSGIKLKIEEMVEPNDISLVKEPETEEEEEYTCSACNIRFTSIYEHIKQFHNGQEVVVEVPEEEIKEDLKAYQENTDSKVSIGESDPDKALENDQTSLISVKEEKLSPKIKSPIRDKRSKETTGFAATGVPSDLVYTRTFKKVKKNTGEHWVQIQSEKKKYFQFVRDDDKYKLLMKELKNNTSIHPEFELPVKNMFECPKINVVEITYRPNSPFLIHRKVNFKNPMPMYIVDRQVTNDPAMLGGIASYITAGKGADSLDAMEDSKVIGVMKVILASDKELTVENIVFNDKPANPDMVPVLEDVKNPDIPLLEDAKILKWKCKRCLATTWKFPLHKETHYCNACPICHKTFISPVSLKKHLVLHKRDGTKYCKECRAAFVSKVNLNSHLDLHITHVLCDLCELFVPKDKDEEHAEIHKKDPSEQFPCSICKKVFGSGQDLKTHETNLCSKLAGRFTCSLCDKKFYSLLALSFHNIAHNNASVKYCCRFCSKTFIQEKEQCPKKAGKRKPSGSIQKLWHERIHMKDRPYMCRSCPKRFRSMEHEKQHNARTHDTSRVPLRNVHVHMCTYCDRVFCSEKQLTNHMMQHTAATVE